MNLLVRPVTPEDAGDLIRANQESVAYHAPWVQSFTDQAGFDAWFAQTLTGAKVALIARDAASGGVVGLVNLNQIVRFAFQSAYLGYFGMAAFAGSGLMTEAVRQAIGYAFDEVGLHRLEANIQPDNVRSIALVRRLGFRLEGLSPRYLLIGGAWRDHERWAILADEFVRT
jgi:[ribosomal protein S5]-alanine N-acetyltransferase